MLLLRKLRWDFSYLKIIENMNNNCEVIRI